jgi:hypothetical protein
MNGSLTLELAVEVSLDRADTPRAALGEVATPMMEQPARQPVQDAPAVWFRLRPLGLHC